MEDVTIQAIRERAYAIWEKEGRPDGCEDRHWTQATTEVTAEMMASEAYGLEPETVQTMRKRARRSSVLTTRAPMQTR